MDKMPKEIKVLLRKYAKHQQEALRLNEQIQGVFEEYGVPYDNLVATSDPYSGEPFTEALAFLNNSETSNLEGSIKEIEEIFLYFVNK